MEQLAHYAREGLPEAYGMYLNALVAALCGHGVNVTLRTDGGTDADFALMVRARVLDAGRLVG